MMKIKQVFLIEQVMTVCKFLASNLTCGDMTETVEIQVNNYKKIGTKKMKGVVVYLLRFILHCNLYVFTTQLPPEH